MGRIWLAKRVPEGVDVGVGVDEGGALVVAGGTVVAGDLVVAGGTVVAGALVVAGGTVVAGVLVVGGGMVVGGAMVVGAGTVDTGLSGTLGSSVTCAAQKRIRTITWRAAPQHGLTCDHTFPRRLHCPGTRKPVLPASMRVVRQA